MTRIHRQGLVACTLVIAVGAGLLVACSSAPMHEVYRSSVTIQQPDQFSPWHASSLAKAEQVLKDAGYTIDSSSKRKLEAHLTDQFFDAGPQGGADRRIRLSSSGERVESTVILRYKPITGKHPYGGLPDALARLREQEKAVLASLAEQAPAGSVRLGP
jgi:hypothetical protein